MVTLCSTVVLLILFLEFASCEKINKIPVVGILTLPAPQKFSSYGNSYMDSGYVKWIESSGSRVAPIPHLGSEEELRKIFSSINGLVLTGGDLVLSRNGKYFQSAQYLWKLAMEANRNHDYFPVWGTCQGFQLMAILTANNFSVMDVGIFDAENLALPLDFTKEASKSRMFRDMDAAVFKYFEDEKVTINLHKNGVKPYQFSGNPELKQMYKLLSVNKDRNGLAFGSSFEAINMPLYAVQFHPERTAFYWDVKEEVTQHSGHAVRCMQHLSNFFVEECRHNLHQFPSEKALSSSMIYNYQPYFTGTWSNYTFLDEQTYIFKDLAITF